MIEGILFGVWLTVVVVGMWVVASRAARRSSEHRALVPEASEERERLTETALRESVGLLRERKFDAAHALLASIDRIGLDESLLDLLDACLAWTYVNLGDDDAALTYAHSTSKSKEPIAVLLAGATLARLERFVEAAQPLRSATHSTDLEDSDLCLALYHLGETERALGRFDEAREAWQRIRQKMPESELAKRAGDQLKTLTAVPYR